MNTLSSGTGVYFDTISATSSAGRIIETFTKTNVNYTTVTKGMYMATRTFTCLSTLSTTYAITTSYFTTLTSDGILIDALDYTSTGALS